MCSDRFGTRWWCGRARLLGIVAAAATCLLTTVLVAEPPASEHAAPHREDDATVAFQVDINPEARVKLRERTPPQRLVCQRMQRFLVEVHNEAGLTAPLRLRAFDRSLPGEQEAGWFHVGFVENGDSSALLSGARTEWKLIELRCDEAGTRTVRIAADAGTGTQDLGFRAEVDLVIDVEERP